jgi:hypothetical protein
MRHKYNKILYFVTAIFIMFNFATCKKDSTSNTNEESHTAIKKIAELEKNSLIKDTIIKLAGKEMQGRFPGNVKHSNLLNFLETKMSNLGLQTVEGLDSSFKQKFINTSGHTTANILGQIKGQKNKKIIIGAHFDHLGLSSEACRKYYNKDNICYGADDNASGVSAVLELARIFISLNKKPTYTLVFILFSSEESGKEGSKFFLEHTSQEDIAFMFNFDMVGRLRENKLRAWGFGSSTEGQQIIKSLKHDLILDYSDVLAPNSDHWFFYENSIPIGMFHTGLHDEYHSSRDKIETINFAGIKKIVTLTFTFLNQLMKKDSITFKKIRHELNLSSDKLSNCGAKIH